MALRKKDKYRVKGSFGELEDPTVAEYESEYMSESSKKTCHLNSFMEYWKRRRTIATESSIYDLPCFR